MARLVPNPLGDVLSPVNRLEQSVRRLESAIGDLHEETAALRILPQIADSLARIEADMARLAEVLIEQARS